MNRFISIGLTIAVAPTILLAIGQWIESPETIEVSVLALIYFAIPLGGLLIVVGLCKALIDTINPPPLAQKVTKQAQMKRELASLVRFSRWVWSECCVAYNILYRVAENRAFWREQINDSTAALKYFFSQLMRFLRWVSNGCYLIYRATKKPLFWRGMLNDSGDFLKWLFWLFVRQIIPLILTAVLGLFVAGAFYLPIAFDVVGRVALTLGGMALVYGAESVARLGHVQVCGSPSGIFAGVVCKNHNVGEAAIVFWLIFYVWWILRKRSAVARQSK